MTPQDIGLILISCGLMTFIFTAAGFMLLLARR